MSWSTVLLHLSFLFWRRWDSCAVLTVRLASFAYLPPHRVAGRATSLVDDGVQQILLDKFKHLRESDFSVVDPDAWCLDRFCGNAMSLKKILRRAKHLKVGIAWVETRKLNPVVFEENAQIMRTDRLSVTKVGDHDNALLDIGVDKHVAPHADFSCVDTRVCLAILIEHGRFEHSEVWAYFSSQDLREKTTIFQILDG